MAGKKKPIYPLTLFPEVTRLPGLAGRTALVTGATRGMGRAIAQLLAECGARVAVNGRDAGEVDEVVDSLRMLHGREFLECPGDVSSLAEVKAMFDRLREWGDGTLQTLVCNAGYALKEELWQTPLHAMSDDQLTAGFEAVRRVDVDGARFCAREAIKLMLPQLRGSLVFISSTPALSGYRGTPYTEAKAALLGLMRDLAREYAPFGIRANALALGNIQSGWYHALRPDERESLKAETPMGRWGTKEEVAGAVAFLASDLSGYISGQTLVVDGGKIIR